MSMVKWRIKISLPLDWKDKLEQVSKAEGYRSIQDYIEELIRQDLKKRGMLPTPPKTPVLEVEEP